MYLVFDTSQGRYVKLHRLPRRAVTPPEPGQIKWELEGWPNYCVCFRNLVWHRPYTTGHGRARGWQQIRKQTKNGSPGFTFRKDSRPYWMSARQLRRKLIRVA